LSVSAPLAGFTPRLKDGEKGKVIIIGAGVSGIAAAQELKGAGYEVTIIEGRDRIGGRIWTDHSLDTPLDLGAGWIHESDGGNPITALCLQHDIPRKKSDFDSLYLYNYDGRPFTDDDMVDIYFNSQNIIQKGTKWGYKQDKDVSMQDCIDHVTDNTMLDSDTMMRLNWRICTEEMDAGTDFDKLSCWGDKEKSFDGPDMIFPEGYGQLMEKMAYGIDILLNATVNRIEYNDRGGVVFYDGKQLAADHIICTVPLGVLKKGVISFSPELPSYKKEAIDRLGMGVLDKIALKFDNCFWPKDKHFIGYVSKDRGEFPIFVNWAYYTGKPYLLGTLTQEFSKELQGKSEEELIEAVFKVLLKMYPDAEKPVAAKLTNWNDDKFSYGSYSHMKVGGKGEDYDTLSQPLGRLRFAGEATMRGFAATVHGAILSGLREAYILMGGVKN